MKRVVIDIEDEVYSDITHFSVPMLPDIYPFIMANAIANGKVLPERHGDLIDRSELLRVLETEIMYTEDTKRRATLNYVFCVLVFSVPTVIEGEVKNEQA